MRRLANDDTHPDIRNRMLAVVEHITPQLVEKAKDRLNELLSRFNIVVYSFDLKPNLLKHIIIDGEGYFNFRSSLHELFESHIFELEHNPRQLLIQDMRVWMAEYGSILQEFVGDTPMYKTLAEKTKVAKRRLEMKDEKGKLIAMTAMGILGRVVGSVFVLVLGLFLPNGQMPSLSEFLFEGQSKKLLKYISLL